MVKCPSEARKKHFFLVHPPIAPPLSPLPSPPPSSSPTGAHPTIIPTTSRVLQNEYCGGNYAFSLYKMEWPESPADDPEYVGCYRDERSDRVMAEKFTQGDMTPAVCREYCMDKDASYYGTQVSHLLLVL